MTWLSFWSGMQIALTQIRAAKLRSVLTVLGVIIGTGTIIGVGDGDPSSHEADKASQRSVFNGLAQVIVQSPNHRAKTIGTPPTFRTRAVSVVPTALADPGLGQVLHANNPLGLVRNVPSWPGHGDILHESHS